MSTERTPHPAFSYLIYLGCAIAFCTIPFGLSAGRNLFFVSSYIAFIAVCLNLKFYVKNKQNLVLPILFFTVGMATILWRTYFKQPDEYIDIYRAYMGTGKLQIATAFILLIALNERLNMKRWFIALALMIGLSVNFYGLYQGLFLHIERVELNFDRATGASYLMTAISLAMMHAILLLRTKYRLPLYIVGFIFTFSTIIMTGTRAAMLVYPVAVALSILLTKDLISKKHKAILAIAAPFVLAACGFLFKSEIEYRIADFETNLKMADQPQIDNSIMSRVSMQRVAIQAGNAAPLGQSAEQRGNEIKAIVAKDPNLVGVMPYITVHMHNELLETYSIKGVWGVAFLLALYIGLFISSLRPYRNPLLLGTTVSLFAYGLSDVVFFSIEATAIFCLVIIFSVLSVANRNKQQD